ncbi:MULTISPECIES: helix-turn-helix transcriptional regulator [unclassified Saccharothrix]|uniref:helix-turn-helix transcriptional regulator n=1 Tax=unclassified Saccharothrix TaxID=2593673 RepID=UPI00307FB394
MDSRTEDRVRHDLAALVDAGLGVAAFCAAAGPLVARAVPSSTGASDAPTWYTLDPRSLVVTGVHGPQCVLDTAAQMRWEYLDDDVNKSIDVVRNPTGVQTLAEVTDGDPWRSPIYRDYMHDHDLAQEMVVALRGTDGRVWATVRLNRPRAAPAFDESDRRFMLSVAPCLADGIRRGLLADATSDAPTPAAPGLVVVDRLGVPVAVSATTREWLALFPGGPRSDGELPLPVHAVSFAALAGACGSAVLRVRLVNGHWATLHGLLTEFGTTGAVSVVIGPAGREHLVPLTAAIYGLTPREQQVAELVLSGHATRRIARGLGISPYTAQEHLRHIFAKVGVGSRGELVAACYLG